MSSLNPVDQQNPSWQCTVLLASDSSQSIIAEVADSTTNNIAYSAYGEQSAQQEVATQLGFNGQLREARIGWYMLGNGYRAYNPRLMRFHSPDSWSPFGRGGLNAYMYCVGDPVNRVDPTGHVPWIEPWFKKLAGNVAKFIFGGSDVTGPSRTRALKATESTGRRMSVERGDLEGMSKVGGAVAASSPTVVTTGRYPSKGDGSTHGMSWRKDTHFAKDPSPGTSRKGRSITNGSPQEPSAPTSPRSVRKPGSSFVKPESSREVGLKPLFAPSSNNLPANNTSSKAYRLHAIFQEYHNAQPSGRPPPYTQVMQEIAMENIRNGGMK